MEEFPAHPAVGPPENRRLPKQASAFTKALEKTALEMEGILGVNAIILKPMMGKIDFEHANPPSSPRQQLARIVNVIPGRSYI